MDKEMLYTVAGGILGSIIEEGIEEIFPGVGELGWTGEIVGSISGFLSSKITKDEIKHSCEIFIKYAYRQVNRGTAEINIDEADLLVFEKHFNKLPKIKKKEILNSFKGISPYEYDFIVEFLQEVEV